MSCLQVSGRGFSLFRKATQRTKTSFWSSVCASNFPFGPPVVGCETSLAHSQRPKFRIPDKAVSRAFLLRLTCEANSISKIMLQQCEESLVYFKISKGADGVFRFQLPVPFLFRRHISLKLHMFCRVARTCIQMRWLLRRSRRWLAEKRHVLVEARTGPTVVAPASITTFAGRKGTCTR